MDKFLWLLIFLLLPPVTFTIYFLFIVNFGFPLFPSLPEGNEVIKIRGLGSHSPSGLLQTPELARSTGANWYHIKMCVRFTEDGECINFPTQETWVRNQIRRAHRVGLKVLLVPFIASAAKPSMPGNISLPKTSWKKFFDCATKLTLEAARIAKKVEMLATANEVWSFTNEEEASKWYQFIFPE